MEEKWTLAKIQQFITDEIEESNSLDYKAAGALAKSDGKRNEISKDVSAMANSNGGIIIYGIREFDDKEKKHLPEKIDPVKRSDFSKEWLEQVINSKIQPKIDAVKIYSVEVSATDNTVVYVVEIPKGTTAHQASSKRYYKRYNFESAAMEDYEIRDVMNRNTTPEIVLDFEIESITKQLNTSESSYETKTDNTLKIIPRNIGSIYANYVNYYITVNKYFLDSEEVKSLKASKDERGVKHVEFYGENTIRDVVGVDDNLHAQYGPSRYDPILPKMHTRPEKLKLTSLISQFNDWIIKWKVYADNALPKEGSVKIGDIPVIKDKNSYE